MTNEEEKVVDRILAAKEEAGDDAYLWLHDSGDCILWSTEADSVNDDGARAVARWYLTIDEVDDLIETGEVDDIS